MIRSVCLTILTCLLMLTAGCAKSAHQTGQDQLRHLEDVGTGGNQDGHGGHPGITREAVISDHR